MASIAFPTISTSTRLPNGTTYSYAHVEPRDNKPYILFLHGWPDSSHGWHKQVPYFSDLGYGLIVPDLLGYGGTDKPEDLEAYRLKKMCGEVIGILDHHGIKEVVGVGHDWGSFLLSRMVNYHPTRFLKYIFLDVAYSPPTGAFDLDAINATTEKALGYPIFGYWYFFNDADAGKLMDENPESIRTLKYTTSPSFMQKTMCPLNACRTYFLTSSTAPTTPTTPSPISPSPFTPTETSTFQQIFSPTNGGFGPSLNWYKAQIRNLNAADESAVAEEDKVIRKEVLLVTCRDDAIAVPRLQEEGMRGFVGEEGRLLKVVEMGSGHFVQLERAGEVNECIRGFVEGE
ncbi:hypothetical protein ACLMJK_004730 [Lecanora helva]